MLGISLSYVSNETVAGWDVLLAKFKSGGVTDIFYNVLASGAHYNSAIYPKSSAMKNGFDSLSYAIGAAHEMNMRVHAWLSFGAYLPYLSSDFAISTGNFADFGNPDARDAMRAMTAEIVSMYSEVDGVDFDYCRYPAFGASKYYTAQNVYDAVYACANEAPGKLRSMHVKAYKGDPDNWGQPYPALYEDGAITLIVPMVYRPFLYGDFTPHIEAWTNTCGVPRRDIMPKLSVIDTASTSEAYKTDAALATELAWWQALGFAHLAVFDQRATLEHLRAVAALLPEESAEPEALLNDIRDEIAETRAALIESAAGFDGRADVLEGEAAALRVMANELRTQAANLDEADTSAEELSALLQDDKNG